MERCKKCKKGEIRQQVSIYVDLPADYFALNKKGIRSKKVKILGAGWPTATLYCTKCSWFLRLNNSEETKM